MKNETAVWAISVIISAVVLLCISIPQIYDGSRVERVSDMDTDAAFDELRSLEHTTKVEAAENADSAYSGMKALEKFADQTIQNDQADRRKRHVLRVKTSLLRHTGHGRASSPSSALPLPP